MNAASMNDVSSGDDSSDEDDDDRGDSASGNDVNNNRYLRPTKTIFWFQGPPLSLLTFLHKYQRLSLYQYIIKVIKTQFFTVNNGTNFKTSKKNAFLYHIFHEKWPENQKVNFE